MASLVLDGVLAVCNRSCVRVGIFIMMVSPKELLRTKADAFVLDGMRLIKISENATTINYESEQGNIKVKAFCPAMS